MRISNFERQVIVETIQRYDPSAEVYLFGSRVRDDLKGGDIDLLVLSRSLRLSTKLSILVDLKSKLGERKIDLKILDPQQAPQDPFYAHIRPKAVKLN